MIWLYNRRDDILKDDNLKIKILNSKLIPEKFFVYPKTQDRKFLPTWIKKNPWLAYSKSADGVLCKKCVLFQNSDYVGKGDHEILNNFVETPFRSWKKASEKFKDHSNKLYHKQCEDASDYFLNVRSGKTIDVYSQLNTVDHEQKLANREAVKSIIETILFNAENELPLRGDNDSGPLDLTKLQQSEGKFRRLLRFRVEAGDSALEKHLSKAKKNAMYLSPDIQTEILEISARIIQESLVENINASESFSVLADETMDVSSTEQISLCARYVSVDGSGKHVLKEDFLTFVPISSQCSDYVTQAILNTCRKLGLNMSFLVGQGYDGASAFAGHINGVAAQIKKQFPKAVYVHCASHRLNLAISNAMMVPMIKNCLAVVHEIIKFFKYSSYASKVLEDAIRAYMPDSKKSKLLGLCQTRFIERHDSISDFVELIECIYISLQEISQSPKQTASPKAASFLATLEKSHFLISLLVLETLLSQTVQLLVLLQDVSIDFCSGMSLVKKTIKSLNIMRKNSVNEFKKIFERASKLSKDLFGAEIRKPRTNRRQTLRDNPETNSVEDYFRVSCFIPCLDTVKEQLATRFQDNSTVLQSFQTLMPAFAQLDKADQLKNLAQYYNNNCSDSALLAEYRLWCQDIKDLKLAKITGLIEVLDSCNRKHFPNIYRLLKIFASMPITTCTVERTFSTLKRVKTVPRNKISDEKLSDSVLIAVHSNEIRVKSTDVLDIMAKKKNRRLQL